jgi:hypothetical protein
MAIAPLIIRWGPEASSDVLRRCARCGSRGATLQHPSYVKLGRWVSTVSNGVLSFTRAEARRVCGF